MFTILRRAATLAAPFALAACLSVTSPADPRIADSAQSLQADAARFYAALAIETAPHCSYQQNKHSYDALSLAAAALQARMTERPALAPAGRAMARLVENARASHQAASARADDAHGPCLAPGAIALNAQALDRATSAIAASQTPAGDQ